jgi:transcriptional regulator with GAF, ATPase, and Fis domain
MEYSTRPDEGPLVDPVVLRRSGEGYRAALDRHAREILSRALRAHGGDQSAAAAELGIDLRELEAERRRLGFSR